MKKIITIGGATQDIFIQYEDPQTMQLLSLTKKESFTLLQEGHKIDVEKIHYSSGGGATNTAIGFKKMGLDAKPFCKIGNDEAGKYILKELQKFNIPIDSILTSKYSTAISFIIPSLRHNYTALCFRGANKYLEHNELDEKTLKSADYVYITSLPGQSAKNLPIFAKKAKEYGSQVAVNPGSMQFIKYGQTIFETLSNIDILILNAFEAEKCLQTILKEKGPKELNYSSEKKTLSMPSPELLSYFTTYQTKDGKSLTLTLDNFFQILLNLGPKIIVVTNGAEGVYVGTKDLMQSGIVLFHPSLKTEVVNTIGAGDAFGAAFVGGIALGKTIEEAIVYGILNSTSVVSHLDTRQGLLTIDELENKFSEIKTNKIQKY